MGRGLNLNILCLQSLQSLCYQFIDFGFIIHNILCVAREILSSQGARTDIDANAPKLTWQGYCDEIEIDKSTANHWLNALGAYPG